MLTLFVLDIIQNQGSDDTTVESICRLYEIGRSKGEDEDEEEEEDEDDDLVMKTKSPSL